jgi:hypothetical protein
MKEGMDQRTAKAEEKGKKKSKQQGLGEEDKARERLKTSKARNKK